MSSTLKDAKAAKSQAAKVFGKLVGDVAVGIMPLGGNQYGLKVNLTSKPAKGILLPEQIQGVPVRVEVVGPIRKR